MQFLEKRKADRDAQKTLVCPTATPLSSLNIMDTIFNANNKSDLITQLAAADISVPLRSEKRTKKHTEKFCLCRLLSALSNHNKIHYPIRVNKSERPDFILELPGVTIGVEHTEAVPQNEAHSEFLRQKVDNDEMHFIWRHEPEEPVKKAKVLLKEIDENLYGPPWEGDSVEQNWSNAMLFFIRKKVVSMKKPGYKTCDKNWLLIYDNWPSPALNLEKGIEYLLDKLHQSSLEMHFNKVYIVEMHNIIEVLNNSHNKLSMLNLWL